MHKKRTFGIVVTTCLLCSINAADHTVAKQYTLTGEIVSEEGIEIDATVVVFYESAAEANQSEPIELTSGVFDDNRVVLTGTIETPTLVTISVHDAKGTQHDTETVLSPGDDISFALLANEDSSTDQLLIQSKLRLNIDDSSKFTISGSFGEHGHEWEWATVKVLARGDGNVGTIDFGSVLVGKDSTFTIENKIDEPRAVWIYVRSSDGFNSYVQAILESSSSIVVTLDKTGNGLMASSGVGRHARLIETWASDEEYLALANAHRVALQEYQDAQTVVAAEVVGKADQAADGGTTDENDSTDLGENLTTDEEEQILALALEIPPHERCQHVDLNAVRPGVMDYVSTAYPDYWILQQEMNQFRYRALEKTATESEDPFDALLALELDAFGMLSDEHHRALDVHDSLVSRIDSDLYARRLAPLREKIARTATLARNDRKLVPGQQAPDFTLQSLEGEEIALHDVIKENDVVLVEFWASWCVPCIRKFPDLKHLHTSYRDDGFQVLTISTDDELENWKEGSLEQQFPWIDLGEPEGDGSTPVAVSYGVHIIPKGYLVDSSGCVLQKDLRIDMLSEVLVERFGEAPRSASDKSLDAGEG